MLHRKEETQFNRKIGVTLVGASKFTKLDLKECLRFAPSLVAVDGGAEQVRVVDVEEDECEVGMGCVGGEIVKIDNLETSAWRSWRVDTKTAQDGHSLRQGHFQRFNSSFQT